MFRQKVLSYAPLAGLIFLLFFSWIHLYRTPKELSPAELNTLAEKFQTTIADYVKKQRPEIRHITFHNTQTEPGDRQNKVKVSFSYSLTVEDKKADSEMLMTGTADLNKKGGGRWLLTNFQVTDSLVEFSKPLIIKAGPEKTSPDKTEKEIPRPSPPPTGKGDDSSLLEKTPPKTFAPDKPKE